MEVEVHVEVGETKCSQQRNVLWRSASQRPDADENPVGVGVGVDVDAGVGHTRSSVGKSDCMLCHQSVSSAESDVWCCYCPFECPCYHCRHQTSIGMRTPPGQSHIYHYQQLHPHCGHRHKNHHQKHQRKMHWPRRRKVTHEKKKILLRYQERCQSRGQGTYGQSVHGAADAVDVVAIFADDKRVGCCTPSLQFYSH